MNQHFYYKCFLSCAVILLALFIPLQQIYAGLAGDYDYNGYIDFNDLGTLAEHWLQNSHPGCQGDTDDDCDVDFYDYANMAKSWQIHYCSPITATASSTEGPEFPPLHAIDQSWSTRWSSAFADNQWLQLDLGQIRTIAGLEVFWEAAYAEQYNIEISIDASDWVPVYSENSGDGGYDVFFFPECSARYIRINCITRATPYGNSIWEVFVITGDDCSPTEQWTLVWSDEFDGPTLDMTNWSYQTGDGCPALCGWGNNEWEWYTDNPENLYIDTINGHLVIVAREDHLGHDYTSAKIVSHGKQKFLYGKCEARIQLPSTQGIWAAFWMMPSDSVYGGWAASGEIDIIESINIANTIYGTLHFGGAWPNNAHSGGSYSNGTDFSLDFHKYTIKWEPYVMRWYVDDILYSTKTSSQWYSDGAPGNDLAPFDQYFYFILNVAVGGNWPGYPDETSVFPQQMKVDYVRVYHKNL